MMSEAKVIQTIEMANIANYPIKVRQTLVGAEAIKTKGPKKHWNHLKPNPILKDGHQGEEYYVGEPFIFYISLMTVRNFNVMRDIILNPKRFQNLLSFQKVSKRHINKSKLS